MTILDMCGYQTSLDESTNGIKTISDRAGGVICSGNNVTGDFKSTGIINTANTTSNAQKLLTLVVAPQLQPQRLPTISSLMGIYGEIGLFCDPASSIRGRLDVLKQHITKNNNPWTGTKLSITASWVQILRNQCEWCIINWYSKHQVITIRTIADLLTSVSGAKISFD